MIYKIVDAAAVAVGTMQYSQSPESRPDSRVIRFVANILFSIISQIKIAFTYNTILILLTYLQIESIDDDINK